MRVLSSQASWDITSLVGPVVSVSVPAGARIVREGRSTRTFFAIAEGDAELRSAGRVVGRLGVGDCFGEIYAAGDRAQPFTVVAASPMRVVTIAAAGMNRMCDAIPGLREKLEAALPVTRASGPSRIGDDIVSLAGRRAASGS
jgi:CRP-like cAMP-binding protein